MDTQTEMSTKKTLSEKRHEYYLKHKEQNHRQTLISNIRTRGRVPFLRTVLRFRLTTEEIVEAWEMYKAKAEANDFEICHLRAMEMKVLIGNMMI